MHGKLAGYYKIKLRKQGYRLVYGVQDDILLVMVLAVDTREDGAVYQSAMARMATLISELSQTRYQINSFSRMKDGRYKPFLSFICSNRCSGRWRTHEPKVRLMARLLSKSTA